MLDYVINQLFQDKVITIIINVLPLVWAIYLYKKEHFKPLVQHKNQLILEQIVAPFYESIELHLFETITEQNKQETLMRLSIFVEYLREQQLLFYLNSHIAEPLFYIEKHCILSDKLTIEELDKKYQRFSSAYFQLSWQLRKYCHIESQEGAYRKQMRLLPAKEKGKYLMQPAQILQFLVLTIFFSIYLTILLYRFFPAENLLPQATIVENLFWIACIAYTVYAIWLMKYQTVQKCIILIKGVIKPH